MTVYLPTGAPAIAALRGEGEGRVAGLDAAPRDPGRLRIALVNLMPDKPATERQFARQLSGWPSDVELVLVRMATHQSSHTDPDHLHRFYRRASEVCWRNIDGLIVTGAPVEHLPFEQVRYWRELTEIIDRVAARLPSLYVCWSGQAALYHRHGVPKQPLGRKAFGVFPQTVERPDAEVLRGLGPNFLCPVSRHTEVRREVLPRCSGLRVLAASPISGLCLVEDRPAGALMMFNHLEYESDTLTGEYRRDRAAGCDIAPPEGLAAGAGPREAWRPAAARFFSNWLDLAAAGRHRGGRLPDGAVNWRGAARPNARPGSRID